VEITIRNANKAIKLWDHFLTNKWDVSIQETLSGVQSIRTSSLFLIAEGFHLELDPTTTEFRVSVRAACLIDGKTYPLVHLQQDFSISDDKLVPLRWKKGRPTDQLGFTVANPNLHPLIKLSGSELQLDIQFVDITEIYYSLHGQSAWFRAYRNLNSTKLTVYFMASLIGHPLIWYLAIPESIYSASEVKPAIMVMPADYGAISYEYSFKGLQASAHGISVGNYQSGLEILMRLLLEPISDERYEKLLPNYVALRKTFRGAENSLPAALHHYRSVLTYSIDAGELVPNYWDVPLGFERAIFDNKYLLMVPLMNGGEGGSLKKAGIDKQIRNAINSIYSHGTVLHSSSIQVKNPVLVAYSQSGGNIFSCAKANLSAVGGLILFEPQYMTDFMPSEDRSLALGKAVIPELLKLGAKVVLVGRYKDLPNKYLPDGNGAGITKLPDDKNYSILDYPFAKSGGLSASNSLIKHRYSRLVASKADKAAASILGSEDLQVYDQKTIESESKVEKFIADHKKNGGDDESLVRRVFKSSYLVDTSGGYYRHNLILAGGQDFDPSTKQYKGFMDIALRSI
jgi:hypothetical protein